MIPERIAWQPGCGKCFLCALHEALHEEQSADYDGTWTLALTATLAAGLVVAGPSLVKDALRDSTCPVHRSHYWPNALRRAVDLLGIDQERQQQWFGCGLEDRKKGDE